MDRRWRAFDRETINAEFLTVPQEDRRRLKYAVENYALDSGAHYRVEAYGEGLMMVTDAARGQGRCLFFTLREVDGEEVLTALLVYEKEGQKAPRNILETARRRMRQSQ